jgi:hypothetical protein
MSVDLTTWYARGYTPAEVNPLHLLRNPHGHSPLMLRDARVWAADEIERLQVPKFFPILRGGASIPWGLIAPHEAQAQRNHGQSLKRLAERGGLSASEAVAVLENRPWQPMADAGPRLVQLHRAWLETQR